MWKCRAGGDMSLALKSALVAHRVKNALGLRSIFLDNVDYGAVIRARQDVECWFCRRLQASISLHAHGLSASIVERSFWKISYWVKENAFRVKTDFEPWVLLAELREHRVCAQWTSCAEWQVKSMNQNCTVPSLTTNETQDTIT